MKELMDASCRVALAAMLHDAGKFAERARVELDSQTIDANKQLYCPHRKQFTDAEGHFTHVHAAYTGMAIDLIERNLPELVGEDVSPFASWKSDDVADSLINAAAGHHKPRTFLQWVIATADRVASGFERERFEHYNQSSERTETGRNHYTARLLTLFEQIDLGDKPGGDRGKAGFVWRYPLQALMPQAMFPRKAEACEGNDNIAAQAEYKQLWDGFVEHLEHIPKPHRKQWALWLDHFDSLWLAFTHAIPSATAGGAKPDVSLYDHSRTTAALAVALWRWHEANRRCDADAVRLLRERVDWDERKLLLVMGDFFGIQDFIFASGGETKKKAAKLLRGRSFQVSLLTECAALRVLDELGLPPTSQVINAAGKFLIVAPNTSEVVAGLTRVQKEIDGWFLKHTFGQSGIGLSWTEAACDDFLGEEQGEPRFRRLLARLFAQVENRKFACFDLCGKDAPEGVFDGFLDAFDPHLGVCAVDGHSPALVEKEGCLLSALAADQIDIGHHLVHRSRVLITTENLGHNTLGVPLFGYFVSFTGAEEESGMFGALAKDGRLRRAWDFSCPEAEDQVLFSGYARRNINAHVPLMGDDDVLADDRYKGLEGETDPRAPKTFEHLARDDLWMDERGAWRGLEALCVLKGDVDNLGRIFEKGLEKPTFARWAALSRQMNAFFAVHLPLLCKREYPGVYTVFAGGDDFFLIGPWLSVIRLARRMRDDFTRWVADNPEIHFSAGAVLSKPGLPVPNLGAMGEEALERSKGMAGKDALTVFGETMRWSEFEVLWRTHERIAELGEKYGLSTGYLYRLQDLAWMSENLISAREPDYENAIWQSWFAYRTWRMLERNRSLPKSRRNDAIVELAEGLRDPIAQFGSRFRVPLFLHLYHQR